MAFSVPVATRRHLSVSIGSAPTADRHSTLFKPGQYVPTAGLSSLLRGAWIAGICIPCTNGCLARSSLLASDSGVAPDASSGVALGARIWVEGRRRVLAAARSLRERGGRGVRPYRRLFSYNIHPLSSRIKVGIGGTISPAKYGSLSPCAALPLFV